MSEDRQRSTDATNHLAATPETQSGRSALDRGSVIGLVGALLVEINDEMIAAESRYIATVELSLPAAPRT